MSAGLCPDERSALRKGWCPGAWRPMAAADGLLVRLRLTGGILPSASAHAIADLAERHGNGRFDLSARANLQMRGIGEAALPTLLEALRALGLVDADAASEAVRNVIASPLAGLHEGFDIRPLVAELEARLAATSELHDLPSKFGFLVDDGSEPSLADVTADVRFAWSGEAQAFEIGLGGTCDEAVRYGTCAAAELVETAEHIARCALPLFDRTDARRMHALFETFGATKLLEAFGVAPTLIRHPTPTEAAARRRSPDQGSALHDGGDHLCVTAPYGRLDAAMLRVAADLAATGESELRLTPWRSLILPGVVMGGPSVAEAKRVGFIVEPGDPRLAVAACVGAPECARGTTRTHDDADALADLAAAIPGTGTRLHVSGCAKGCAKPSASAVTLVGCGGRYDVVRDGRPGDAPVGMRLDLAAVRVALTALVTP